MANIETHHVECRMYKLGTGDCFVLKFYSDESTICFKMMIDAGGAYLSKAWSDKVFKTLLKDIENELDLLIVTHEHSDHVLGFEKSKDLLENILKVKEIWLAWTEDDNDSKVNEWKKKYGEKKKLMHDLYNIMNRKMEDLTVSTKSNDSFYSKFMLNNFNRQKAVIDDFLKLSLRTDNNFNIEKIYKGGLEGMDIVKKRFGDLDTIIRFKKQGEIVTDFERKTGLKFFILGPPPLYEDIKLETGGEGESYDHSQNNKDFNEAFLNAIESHKDDIPFDEEFIQKGNSRMHKKYNSLEWRKIDHDWIFSSATFALRMNSLTNNLSLAMAIEVSHTGEVLLFPGDAEYGSWASWHKINWGFESNGKHLTEDLLNRTILYKVAHHMSHNGTAKTKGLNMMTSDNLTAMIPLDYNKIYDGWKSTMPNRYILDELMDKTKGKMVFSSTKGIKIDEVELSKRIKDRISQLNKHERNQIENNFKSKEHFEQVTLYFNT